MNKTAVSLFSGIGGFDVALRQHGYNIIHASDIDPAVVSVYNYRDNHDNRAIVADIKDIQYQRLNRTIDLLTAGFPCPAFSIAGLGGGFSDSRGQLFFNLLNFIKTNKPSAILLENVKGLLSHDNGRTIETILERLSYLGYDDVQAQLYNMAMYGLPQSRERVIITGTLQGLSLSLYFRQDMGNTGNTGNPTPVSSCIGVFNGDNVNNLPHYPIGQMTPYKRSIRPRPYYPLRIGCVSPSCGQATRVYSVDHVAPTLSTSGTGLYLINNVIRGLSTREALCVSGFPTTFQFPPHIQQQQKKAVGMIGNAIPPSFVYQILR